MWRMGVIGELTFVFLLLLLFDGEHSKFELSLHSWWRYGVLEEIQLESIKYAFERMKVCFFGDHLRKQWLQFGKKRGKNPKTPLFSSTTHILIITIMISQYACPNTKQLKRYHKKEKSIFGQCTKWHKSFGRDIHSDQPNAIGENKRSFCSITRAYT